MNFFAIVAAAVVAGIVLSKYQSGGLSGILSFGGGQSATPGAANLQSRNAAVLNSQLAALYRAQQQGQPGTQQQIKALNTALQQLIKQQAAAKAGGSKGGGGGSSAGSQNAGSAGNSKSPQNDPIAAAFLASNLNGPQAGAAESVLKAGGTIDDAAAAAGVSPQQIIDAISPQIGNIIAQTAPTESITNTDPTQLTPIDPNGPNGVQTFETIGGENFFIPPDGSTPIDLGAAPTPSTTNTTGFIDPVSATPASAPDGTTPIDPAAGAMQDNAGLNQVASFIGQDPATDPSVTLDPNNSMVGSNFTPSTADMSSGNPTPAFDPSSSDITSPDWNGNGSSGGDWATINLGSGVDLGGGGGGGDFTGFDNVDASTL